MTIATSSPERGASSPAPSTSRRIRHAIRNRARRAVPVLVAASCALSATLLAGCGSDSAAPSAPGQSTDSTNTGAGGTPGASFDIGGLVHSLPYANINSFAGVRAQLSVPTGLSDPPFDASLCVFSTTSQFFVCPAVNLVSMTFATSYAAFDATGAILPRLNGGNVARVHFVRTGRGTVVLSVGSGAPNTIAVLDSSDVTATGLASGPRTFNGFTKSHYESTVQAGVVTTSVYDLTTTVTGVTLPAASASAQWPTAGSVTADMHAVSVNVGATTPIVDTHAVLTYNGTSTALLVTTTANVTRNCQVDLTGVVGTACK